MKFRNLFRKKGSKEGPGLFSEFFLYASEEEKEKVFREAARRANEEQRRVFMKSHLKTKTN
jgi:hypothetical protein